MEINNGAIQINDLYFSFSKFDKPILKGINLEIGSGKKVAIIGKSGSGKSTLLKLITGLYHYEYGSIKIDNQEINHYNLKSYREQIGIVVQEPQIFKGTIRENITFGRNMEIEKYNKALELSSAKDIINNYHLGDKMILSEQGVNISGGERQRIALARAFLDFPKIMVLDEPTSSLDNESEKRIMDNIRTLECTCLVVAHRFYNIELYDEIILMDNGQIVGMGTHESLIQSNTLYRSLYFQK